MKITITSVVQMEMPDGTVAKGQDLSEVCALTAGDLLATLVQQWLGEGTDMQFGVKVSMGPKSWTMRWQEGDPPPVRPG